MVTCENCKKHSVAGFRIHPAVPECHNNGVIRELPNSVQPTAEGGHDNLWNGVTPDWCPSNMILVADSYKLTQID